MLANRLLPKLLLIAGTLSLLLIIKLQGPIKSFLGFNLEKARIRTDNFFFEGGPQQERQRPFSLMERETELKLYIGEPFRGFNTEDWKEFWQIIYGGYPIENPGKGGLPNKMRQLSQEEIASILIRKYPQPFSDFGQNHWKLFFDILKVK
jgi:hypothetical protein